MEAKDAIKDINVNELGNYSLETITLLKNALKKEGMI